MKKKESKNPEESRLIKDGEEKERVNPCKISLFTIIFVVILAGIGVVIMNYKMAIKSPKASRKLLSSIRGQNSSEAPGVSTKIKISKSALANDEVCNKFQVSNKNYSGINSSNISAGIFFITDDGILTDQDSCSIEAALKALPDRKIYLLELLCGDRPRQILNGTNYTELLAESYNNFLHISIDGLDYFKDSSLKGKWECDNQMSLFGAMVLTAWAYGSPTLLPEVIINRPDLITTNAVLVSQFVIISNKKCDEFLYNILELIKINENTTYIPKLLSEELINFQKENPSQQVGILDKTDLCDHINKNCVFVIIEDLKKQSASWLVSLSKFCPRVIKDFQESKRSNRIHSPTIQQAHRTCSL